MESESAGQTDSQIDASQRKFEKPELAYGFTRVTKRIRKSARKTQKVVNFTHIQMTCDQLVSTCVRWSNGEKFSVFFRFFSSCFIFCNVSSCCDVLRILTKCSEVVEVNATRKSISKLEILYSPVKLK